MNLENAKVLITGGGTGIGLATAALFREAGAAVVVCGRRREPLDEAARELGVLAVQADVSRAQEVKRLVETVVRELDGYDVLINNAAIGYSAPLLEQDEERFEEVFAVNVTGAMLVARESARHFAAHGGGTIVNVGSTAARKGYPGGTAYAASKFALTGMTECWRAELRKHDVRVMQVNPSEVQTPFGGRVRDAVNPTKLRAEDVARVIQSCVALDDRGFVTETTLWATNPRG